jgi:hypothetical protein
MDRIPSEVLRYAAFTDSGKGGNPAAVVLDARSLSEADMLAIAQESADRCPTGPAADLARAHGLEHPDVVGSLLRWSDYLLKESTHPARSLRPLV